MKTVLPAVVIAVASTAFAADPAPNTSSLTPQVRDAIARLKSADFDAREKAVLDLQKASGEQARALIDGVDKATLDEVFEYQGAISRWAMDTIQFAPTIRDKQLAWGLQPEITPIIAKLYATSAKTRIAGVRELAKLNGDEALQMLARMLDDGDRAVYLAAMEEAEKKKPTDAIVDALYARAVQSSFVTPTARQPVPIVFRGANLGMAWDANAVSRRGQDAHFACDVLVAMKPPQVRDRLLGLFEQAASAMANAENGGHAWQFMPYSPGMRSAVRLAEALQLKEALPYLVVQLEAEIPGIAVRAQPIQVNKKQLFYTQRAPYFVLAAQLSGLKPDDLGMELFASQWYFTDTNGEKKAIEKLRETSRELFPNTTQPAAKTEKPPQTESESPPPVRIK